MRLTPDPQRLAYIQQQLQERGMQVDEVPDDDDVRETYNFAPGSFGAVYRADIPEAQTRSKGDAEAGQEQTEDAPEQVVQEKKDDHTPSAVHPKYKLQSMKWGLIPFWTKRQPDYGSMMRTINCRDDSLIENRGMWTTMKQRKRCIVICQGFYEWLKKGPGGKEKVPHFVRRKDGDLMCFAGLWDCVKYEGVIRITIQAFCFRVLLRM
jgi:putative SOS response-associated peptidase YedK